jgi:hypothetical protein
MSSAILFEDIFDVRQMNPDGKKFERGQNETVLTHVLFPVCIRESSLIVYVMQ